MSLFLSGYSLVCIQKALCLTILIGGNHENPALNTELPHGGWVAPNIYYMGFASVVNVGGLRIAGWSGIFNKDDYKYSEFFPFKLIA